MRSLRRLFALLITWFPGTIGLPDLGTVHAQSSLFDPKFDELRKAATEWDRRTGPDRQVVDVVCLVPDVSTFLEAIKAWDSGHYFPILLDDVEYSFKFIRAFRPARIVRFPGKGKAGNPERLWQSALSSIAETRDGPKIDSAPVLRGDATPKSLGPTPPGVVLSHPDSRSLAGAVALAAGRFQPLLKWETSPKRYGDIPTLAEAKSFASTIETLLKGQGLSFDRLGDDCDFVTLAGDYPYRYDEKGQNNAFDDLILRSSADQSRWGYAGRLTGEPVESLYRAMCSLFLRPDSTVMFNTYADSEPPWSRFATLPAARLGPPNSVTLRAGDRAGLDAWHQQFDPLNRAGLLLINSSGGSMTFRIDAQGNHAHTSDIPESGSVAVHMIHSFSAEQPENPDTLAGRWLANGAYIYYGSVNEPYLESFRTPALLATLLSENMPMAAACRKTHVEAFGQPWRLMYFGDPLFRTKPGRPPSPRLAVWEPLAGWTSYAGMSKLAADAPEPERLARALKAAIQRLQTGTGPKDRFDPTAILETLDRQRLTPKFQRVYDDLLVETWLREGRTADLVARMTKVARPARTPVFRRHLETAQMALLQKASREHDCVGAFALWSEVVRAPGSSGFVRTYTERTATLSEAGGALDSWRLRVQEAAKGGADPANQGIVDSELKRVAK